MDDMRDAVPRTSVEYICEKNLVSTNPYEHKYHDKFIQFMNDPEISDFGRWEHSNGFNTALVAVKCDLDKVPSVTQKQQWTPCSERLPEENVYVLVWCGEVKIARIIHGITKEQRIKMQEGIIDDPVTDGWNLSNGYFQVKRSETYRACDEYGNNKVPYCWDCIYGEMFGQDVKAWMPMPKPYREERDDS